MFFITFICWVFPREPRAVAGVRPFSGSVNVILCVLNKKYGIYSVLSTTAMSRASERLFRFSTTTIVIRNKFSNMSDMATFSIALINRKQWSIFLKSTIQSNYQENVRGYTLFEIDVRILRKIDVHFGKEIIRYYK